MIFQNRQEAGKQLAKKLVSHLALEQPNHKIIVSAIPRGGVVVGTQLANTLSCPLEVIITKKIGAPENPELAVGAVGPEEEMVWNYELLKHLNLTPEQLKKEVQCAKLKIQSYSSKFKVKKLDLEEQVVVLTDDGVATGATMMAAVEIVRQHNPKKIIVAVPMIAKDSLKKIEELADEVIYLDAPEMFFAVGQFYKEFEQVSDEEVIKILRDNRR